VAESFFTWPGALAELPGAAPEFAFPFPLSARAAEERESNPYGYGLQGLFPWIYRSWAPNACSRAETMRFRSSAASSSVSVRSGDWNVTEKAIDFFPGSTWPPR
jgi:hypothetical protein